jgi:hypothetical protein
MMDAILLSMVWLVETVVHYSIGAVLLALAAVGLVAACRGLLTHPDRGSPAAGAGPALRTGTGSLVAVGTLAGVGCLLAALVAGMR